MQTNGGGCSSVPLPRVLARTTLMVLLLMFLPHRPPTPRHPDTWAWQHHHHNQPQAEARNRCTASKIVWGDARKWKSYTRWPWPMVWHRGCGVRGNTVTNARCWPVSHDKTLSNQTIGTQSPATFLRSLLSRASNESLQRLKLYNHRKGPYY